MQPIMQPIELEYAELASPADGVRRMLAWMLVIALPLQWAMEVWVLIENGLPTKWMGGPGVPWWEDWLRLLTSWNLVLVHLMWVGALVALVTGFPAVRRWAFRLVLLMAVLTVLLRYTQLANTVYRSVERGSVTAYYVVSWVTGSSERNWPSILSILVLVGVVRTINASQWLAVVWIAVLAGNWFGTFAGALWLESGAFENASTAHAVFSVLATPGYLLLAAAAAMCLWLTPGKRFAAVVVLAVLIFRPAQFTGYGLTSTLSNGESWFAKYELGDWFVYGLNILAAVLTSLGMLLPLFRPAGEKFQNAGADADVAGR